MGYTVLYIAFGVVALWLLGEVLLQYKARLRWRLLAFAGFCGVVAGVLLPSVIVICVGAAGFATGQTFVTLSYRRGFSAGWAIGGRPSPSRRRRAGGGSTAPDTPPMQAEPDAPAGAEEALADGTADEMFSAAPPYQPSGAGYGDGTDATQVYAPMPMPDDTGEYGVYSDHSPYPSAPSAPYAASGYEPYGAQAYGADGTAWHQEQQYAPMPGYEPHEADVFGNAPQPGYGYEQQYPTYQEYPQQAYPQDPYAAQYGYETPPGGVWTPQEQPPHIPQQAPPTHDQPQAAEHYDPYRY